MTSSTGAATAATSAEVLTSSPGRMLRRRAGLIVVAIVVVLAVIALIVIRQSPTVSGDPLDITNPAPVGARAVAQVLGQQGVRVIAADSVRATRSAVGDTGGDPSDTTVLVYDPQNFMTASQRSTLLELGTDLVIVEPGLLALDQYAPSLGLAGTRSGSYDAGCALTAARKAATVTGSGLGYRVLTAPDAAAPGVVTACFRRGGAAGLVQIRDGSRTISILGLGSILQNDTVARRGDAALALNLLGAHSRLVWDISSYADLQSGTAPTLAELTPPWVTPLLVLLALVGVAAMVWRGRRFGPIVIENLPVVVRASETMEGRARLYSRANARLRALDALRIGTIDRLARATGLPRAATVDDVIDTVAAQLARDRGEIATLLLDAEPSSDAALVRLSDQLLTLEADVQNGQHG